MSGNQSGFVEKETTLLAASLMKYVERSPGVSREELSSSFRNIEEEDLLRAIDFLVCSDFVSENVNGKDVRYSIHGNYRQ